MKNEGLRTKICFEALKEQGVSKTPQKTVAKNAETARRIKQNPP